MVPVVLSYITQHVKENTGSFSTRNNTIFEGLIENNLNIK